MNDVQERIGAAEKKHKLLKERLDLVSEKQKAMEERGRLESDFNLKMSDLPERRRKRIEEDVKQRIETGVGWLDSVLSVTSISWLKMIDKSYLIAIGEFRATVTLSPDLLW